MARNFRRIEGHGETLSRALRVPDDSDPLSAIRRSGGNCGLDCAVDRMELMVGGDFLRDRTTVVFEDDEVSKKVEQPILREDPSNQGFKFDTPFGSNFVAFDCAPRNEPFSA